MDALRAMRVFARVIDEGSFVGAARALDLAPAVVTRLVSELEEHLGARLMQRTTRSMALTDVGQNYLDRVRHILADIDEAEAAAHAAQTEPRGHVRVRCPPAVAVHQLAKHLPRFHAQYPHVTLELAASGPVETVDEAFDLTLVMLRKPLDGQFVARRLARSEVIACAAPEYLNRRGRPQHPRDLLAHDVLIPPLSELQRGVTFFRGAPGDAAAESFSGVPTRGPLSTLNVDMNYACALAGLGIAGLPSLVLEDALLEGALERVLPEWRLFSLDLWLCMPTRQHVPARTRVLQAFLLSVFGGQEADPWLATAGCETRCPPALQRSE